MKNVKIDLKKEYKKALTNLSFQELVKKLKLNDEVLMNYTSRLEECATEWGHCKNCKSILECNNRMRGHVLLPKVDKNSLNFYYKPCNKKKKIDKETNFFKNINYFNTPDYLKEASIANIYKRDKNRFPAILWINEFKNTYFNNQKQKGLYLHGNFGCGKTYFIAALFNDLAKDGIECAIVFWPDFIRQAFYSDFKEKYECIKSVPLLLIDDIGAENVTAWNRDEILCPLLQYRMEANLVTFFTSNFNLDELKEHLSISKNGVEEVKAERIIARIKQLSSPLEMISKNLRN